METKESFTQVVFNFPIGKDEEGNDFLPSIEAQKTIDVFDNGVLIGSKTHRGAYSVTEKETIEKTFGDLASRLELQKENAELKAELIAVYESEAEAEPNETD